MANGKFFVTKKQLKEWLENNTSKTFNEDHSESSVLTRYSSKVMKKRAFCYDGKNIEYYENKTNTWRYLKLPNWAIQFQKRIYNNGEYRVNELLNELEVV